MPLTRLHLWLGSLAVVARSAMLDVKRSSEGASMCICYFGEMDSYTGSVRASRELLPGLIARLKMMCALHDFVIVAPGNLVEHALALPLFEALGPLVRAGRLGTSGPKTEGGPLGYVLQRAERAQTGFATVLSKRAPGRAEQRIAELTEVKDRWASILPAAWSLERDVSQVVDSYVGRIQHQLEALSHSPNPLAAQHLLVALDRARCADRISPDRNYLLAQAAELRGLVRPVDLHLALTVIQATYFEQGTSARLKHPVGADTESAAQFVLYPGAFAAQLRRSRSTFNDSLQIPVDWNLRPKALEQRLRAFGISHRMLTELSPKEILELSGDPCWRVLRSAVLETKIWTHELAERAELTRSRLKEGNDLRTALPTLAVVLQSVTPTIYRAPWQPAALAGLGSRQAALSVSTPRAWTWNDSQQCLSEYPSGRTVTLTKEPARLFRLLIHAGDAGLSFDEAEQALTEHDRIASAADSAPVWQPRKHRTESLENSLRDRATVLKHRLARSLAPLGLPIQLHNGRLLLAQHGRIQAVHSPWEFPHQTTRPPRPSWLKGQLLALWELLAQHAPSPVGLGALAIAIGHPDSPSGRVYAAKVISRLRHTLRERKEPSQIVDHHAGQYRLIENGPVTGD